MARPNLHDMLPKQTKKVMIRYLNTDHTRKTVQQEYYLLGLCTDCRPIQLDYLVSICQYALQTYILHFINLPVSKRQFVSFCTRSQTCKLVSHTDTKYWLATIAVQHLQDQPVGIRCQSLRSVFRKEFIKDQNKLSEGLKL